MDSNTSSDIDINILDNRGNIMDIPPLKKESSETDLYLNLLANPTKSKVDSENSTSSLHFDDKHSDKDTSSVRRESYHNIKESSKKHHYSEKYSDRHSDHRSDHRSERRASSHHSDSSKPRYEDVELSASEPPAPKLTPQQLRMKKIDLLRKLSDLKTKGYKLTKEYDFNSSIEEMEYEYDLLKSFADRRNGIKLYKNTIINLTNLVEFFNEKYDPFGAQLEGWAEHMSVEVDSYDDVLEELYEKYKGAGKSLPPEIKLLILIGFSASAFHFSKKHMSSIPGEKGSPLGGLQTGIAQKIASMGKEKSKFMSEQELNIERQREEMREKDRQMKEMMRQKMVPPTQQTNPVNMMQQPSNLVNARAPVNFSFNSQTPFTPGGPPSMVPSNDPRPLINKSETVQDVLNRLHNREVDTIDTQDETEGISRNQSNTRSDIDESNDRLLSDTTASETKKKGKKKKPMMTIQ